MDRKWLTGAFVILLAAAESRGQAGTDQAELHKAATFATNLADKHRRLGLARELLLEQASKFCLPGYDLELVAIRIQSVRTRLGDVGQALHQIKADMEAWRKKLIAQKMRPGDYFRDESKFFSFLDDLLAPETGLLARAETALDELAQEIDNEAVVGPGRAAVYLRKLDHAWTQLSRLMDQLDRTILHLNETTRSEERLVEMLERIQKEHQSVVESLRGQVFRPFFEKLK